jgi:molybdopterin-guanine dinucleotide biosynthesis protein
MATKKLSFARDREQIFHRTALAEDLLQRLVEPAYKSGLFLSAPRRTGKTTFIKADLLPLLREAGAIVIYADLWEQKSINPAKVVIAAIADAILHEGGHITKLAKSMGLKKVKVGGLELDLDAIGTKDGDSIAKTLEKLGAAAGKPIVMVIDEAQHAQTTEEGRDTMFALKAARDAMILGEGEGFRLIATGSNSDRLRTLVSSKDQAFFGAKEEHLPELDDLYLQWVLDNSPFKERLSLPVLRQGFEVFGRRPEPLQGLLTALQGDRDFDPASIDAVFVQRAIQSMEHARQSFLASLRSMDALDAAVYRRMAELGTEFTPFDDGALKHYQELMNRANSDATAERPSKSQVQGALERLRKETMIWNAGRGIWYIEDSQHRAWTVEDRATEDAVQADDDEPGHPRPKG